MSALFALAFRPFYLLAALGAAAGVVGWVAMLEGRIDAVSFLPGVLWHQHEMVFGFALAVIAGFLLTAGRVWTGLPTPTGGPLAALALHWLAARVFMITGPAPLAAAVDGAFPFVLAAVVARVIFGSRNARNYFVVALLVALGSADLAFHLGFEELAVRVALYLVLTLVVVMAGRVVPSFTANALPRARVVRRPRLDRWSVAATLAAFAGDALGLGAWVVAPAALAAAGLHVARQAGWAPLATRREPLLWSLHAAHAWFPVALVLLALASMDIVPRAAALHAFGAGVLGGTVMAMITRTALGHTGRALAAGRAETLAYVLVHAGALLRLLATLAPGIGYMELVGASGLAWSAAFLVYFAVYLPRLMRPRPDGKPG